MKRSNFLRALVGLPLVLSQLSFSKKSKIEKVIFTPDMLNRNNFGLYIINTKAGNFGDIKRNPGYAATVSWKLCYHNDPTKKQGTKSDQYRVSANRYCKINFLTDGWICPIGQDYNEVCAYLNNNPYGETYRLMAKEEVIFLITTRKQGFL